MEKKLFVALGIVIVIVVGVLMIQTFVPPTAFAVDGAGASDAHLLLHLPFATSILTDASGNGREVGSLVNATYVADGGLSGTGGYRFSAVDKNFITLSNMDDYFNRGPFSYFSWVKTTASDDTKVYYIVTKKHVAEDAGWVLFLHKKKFRIGIMSREQNCWTGFSGPDIVDGSWHHVGIVYTGQCAQAYVDGVMIQQLCPGTYKCKMEDSSRAPLMIGGARSSPPQYFEGSIDEVTFFDRALDATEIALLRAHTLNAFSTDAATANPTVSDVYPTDPVLVLHFDEMSNGTSFIDSSGYGQSCFMVGKGPYFVPSGGIDGSGYVSTGGITAEENDMKVPTTQYLDSPEITVLWSMRLPPITDSRILEYVFDKMSGVRLDIYKEYLRFFFPNGNYVLTAPGQEVLRDNEWHHYAVRLLNGKISYYVDGATNGPQDLIVSQDLRFLYPGEVTTLADGLILPSKFNLRLVNRAVPAYYPLNGDLDEFVLWARGLSDAEMSSLFSVAGGTGTTETGTTETGTTGTGTTGTGTTETGTTGTGTGTTGTGTTGTGTTGTGTTETGTTGTGTTGTGTTGTGTTGTGTTGTGTGTTGTGTTGTGTTETGTTGTGTTGTGTGTTGTGTTETGTGTTGTGTTGTGTTETGTTGTGTTGTGTGTTGTGTTGTGTTGTGTTGTGTTGTGTTETGTTETGTTGTGTTGTGTTGTGTTGTGTTGTGTTGTDTGNATTETNTIEAYEGNVSLVELVFAQPATNPLVESLAAAQAQIQMVTATLATIQSGSNFNQEEVDDLLIEQSYLRDHIHSLEEQITTSQQTGDGGDIVLTGTEEDLQVYSLGEVEQDVDAADGESLPDSSGASSHKSAFKWILGIVLLCLVVAGAIFLYLRRSNVKKGGFIVQDSRVNGSNEFPQESNINEKDGL